jgi:TonB family protein
MKPPLLLILLIASFSSSYASDTSYFYLNRDFKPSNKSEAIIIRKAVQLKENEWMILDYTKSNKLFAIRYYADTTFHSSMNCHLYYDTIKGYPRGMQCFKAGKSDGITAGFNEKGDTLFRTTFKDGVAIAHKEFPENGFLEEDKTEPRFPGGALGWQRFLNKNLRYPQKAIDGNIQGTVIISFMVSEEGKLSDFKIEQSVDPSLDEETMRVLKKSGDWLPAEGDGKKIPMRRMQPMVFRIG